jgi:hypothetical protein
MKTSPAVPDAAFSPCPRLAQHWGTYLSGFDWSIYGCGTYRNEVNQRYATITMKRFIERLQRKLHAPVAYFAVLEGRPSGCGLSAIRHHWHFLAASESHEAMATIAHDIWSERFGNAKIDPYDLKGSAAYYVSKLANHENGHILSGNMDLLHYHGPSDLIAAASDSDYVPKRLKDKTFGDFLVMRPVYPA